MAAAVSADLWICARGVEEFYIGRKEVAGEHVIRALEPGDAGVYALRR